MRSGSDAIIMTTRRNTKKFESILANPKVAILVSDFDHRSVSDATGTCSITLNCEVSVPGGAEAERLRAIHAENNPKYVEMFLARLQLPSSGQGRGPLQSPVVHGSAHNLPACRA